MNISALKTSAISPKTIKLKLSLTADRYQGGFTIIELLVSSVILLTATVGSIAAFNLLTGSIRGTGLRTEQSRVIDDNFAEIQYIAESFTSCAVPAGEDPAADPVNALTYCDGGSADWGYGSSFYYFPLIADGLDPTTWTDAETFAAACASDADGNNDLRDNFITAVNQVPTDLVDANGNTLAVRQPAVAFGDGHLVEIVYQAPPPDNRPLRQLVIAPVVASWCP